jgi:hypothetical protein
MMPISARSTLLEPGGTDFLVMEFLEGEYASAHASLMTQSEKFEADMQAAQSLNWTEAVFGRGSLYGVQFYGRSTFSA